MFEKIKKFLFGAAEETKSVYEVSRYTDAKTKTNIELLKKGYLKVDSHLVSAYIDGALYSFAFDVPLKLPPDKIYYIWAENNINTVLETLLKAVSASSNQENKAAIASNYIKALATRLVKEKVLNK